MTGLLPQVATLRFATFQAVEAFVGAFSRQMSRMGSIDAETLDQVNSSVSSRTQ